MNGHVLVYNDGRRVVVEGIRTTKNKPLYTDEQFKRLEKIWATQALEEWKKKNGK